MGDFKFLQYERTGDLVWIAINRPPFPSCCNGY